MLFRSHAFGHLKGDLGVAGDHTAVGAHRVAGVSLLVGLGGGVALIGITLIPLLSGLLSTT